MACLDWRAGALTPAPSCRPQPTSTPPSTTSFCSSTRCGPSTPCIARRCSHYSFSRAVQARRQEGTRASRRTHQLDHRQLAVTASASARRILFLRSLSLLLRLSLCTLVPPPLVPLSYSSSRSCIHSYLTSHTIQTATDTPSLRPHCHSSPAHLRSRLVEREMSKMRSRRLAPSRLACHSGRAVQALLARLLRALRDVNLPSIQPDQGRPSSLSLLHTALTAPKFAISRTEHQKVRCTLAGGCASCPRAVWCLRTRPAIS